MTEYVYDGIEVKLTGRKAVRASSRVITTIKNNITTQELVEITPIDGFNDWKKWVKMNELFEITNGTE